MVSRTDVRRYLMPRGRSPRLISVSLGRVKWLLTDYEVTVNRATQREQGLPSWRLLASFITMSRQSMSEQSRSLQSVFRRALRDDE